MANTPTMSQQDQDALQAAGDAWNAANAAGDTAGMAAAHAQAESIRNNYGYSGGADGSEYNQISRPSQDIQPGNPGYSGSSGSGSSGSGGGSSGDWEQSFMSAADYAALKAAGDAYNNATTAAEREAAHAQAEAIRAKYNYSGGVDGSEYLPFGNQQQQGSLQQGAALQTPDFSGLLDQWLSAAQQQQQNQINYAVNQGVAELERAEEDAQEQFQTQQNQVSEDEAKALDNQALYAEARGDRGGIGQAQYGQIQAQAMQNRQAINSARTKLATDTARAIADLRAQGEFQKADSLLQLTQTYLSQLMQLQQWGAEYSLNVQQFQAQLYQWQQEFNAQLQQWDKEYELSVGDLTGVFQGSPTWSAQQAEKNTLVESGMAALSVGVRPSAAQQQAMGYTDEQIDAILAEYKLAQAAASSSGSSSGGGGGSKGNSTASSGSGAGNAYGSTYQQMYAAGIRSEADAYDYLTSVLGLSSTEAKAKAEYFSLMEDELKAWYDEVKLQEAWDNAVVDQAQAMELFGPVSASGLASLVNEGKAEMYLEDGKIRFRKVASTSTSPSSNKYNIPGLPDLTQLLQNAAAGK